MSTISLCMIAKNEERCIARAITSVLPIVAEVILVDTGSTDRTAEIARELGARVFSQPWQDDFSAPRNLSLQYAESDWILVLDADELIAEQDLAGLQALTADSRICYEFLQRHYSDDFRLSNFTPCRGEFPELEAGHGGYFESNLVRLFPNHQGIHYRGKVHELVEHSIREIGKHTIKRTEIRIHHYGHTTEAKRAKQKSTIYTPLGEAKVREAPQDWKNFFELGVEHNNSGRLEESVAAFRRAAELNPRYVPTWTNMGYVLCELKQYQEAANSLTQALRLDPRNEEAYCNLGVVLLRVKNFPAAEQHFRNAVRLNPTYVNAQCNLATALAFQQRFSEAVAVYTRVLEFLPNCTKAHAEAGTLYLACGVPKKAEYHLLEAAKLSPEDSRTQLHLGQLYKSIGQVMEAARYLQRYCELEEKAYSGIVPPNVAQFIRQIRNECRALTTGE